VFSSSERGIGGEKHLKLEPSRGGYSLEGGRKGKARDRRDSFGKRGEVQVKVNGESLDEDRKQKQLKKD